MRAHVLGSLLLLVACGEAQPTVTSPERPTGAAGSTSSGAANSPGGHGSVCACGERANVPNCNAAPCKAGLVCGYGCGIPGCDSTCMTTAEADEARKIP